MGLSFPGEIREIVAPVAETLEKALGRPRVLYDGFHRPEFARPDLDVHLPPLYRDQTDLIVVVLCREYPKKEWPYLEWRYVRELIRKQAPERIMLVRVDDVDVTDIPGLTSGDGVLDARTMSPAAIARAIEERLKLAPPSPSKEPADAHAYRVWLEGEPTALPRLFRLDDDTHALPDVYVEVELEATGPAELRGPRRLDQVLELDRRWWSLKGEPGAGKSTLLKMTALRLLESKAALPVLTTVKALQPAPEGLGVPEEHRPVVTAAVAEGRAVFLIDGFDEVPDREAAKTAVRALAGRVETCRGVVAGREEAFPGDGLGLGFEMLRALPLSEPERLLEKRLGDAALAARVASRLREDNLEEFLQNPLLLTLVALRVKDGRGLDALPRHRVALLEEAVEVLCREHPLERGLAFSDPDAGRRALAEVALRLHGQPGDRLDHEAVVEGLAAPATVGERALDRLRGWFGRGPPEARRADAERFIDEVAKVTGFVEIRTGFRGRREVRFSHRTLREHLAATRLAELVRRDGVKSRRVAEVLAQTGKEPAVWAETVAQAVALLGGRGEAPPDPNALAALVGAVAERSPTVAFRAAREAERLPAAVLAALLAMDPSRAAWEARFRLLNRTPELVEDAHDAVDVLDRFRSRTTHGADLFGVWWALGRVAHGGGPAAEAARAARARVFEHLSDSARQQAIAELAPQWRLIPQLEVMLPYAFRMGSEPDEEGRLHREGPPHPVRLSSRFELQSVPVTNRQYERFDPGHAQERAFEDRGDDTAAHPVVNVSWYEAFMFAWWVGARLPTEAEWECACRARTQTRFHSGDLDEDLLKVGWVGKNSDGHTHPVAEKPANDWGLHDMHGNVWEWVEDCWHESYEGAPDDGSAWMGEGGGDCTRAVVRGGSWLIGPQFVRSAYRLRSSRVDRGYDLGFRVARTLPGRQDGKP
ncbi:MAG: SUMF1/EgtB/PvdO family nonheme iron enzyme [Myxococcota bacterium]